MFPSGMVCQNNEMQNAIDGKELDMSHTSPIFKLRSSRINLEWK